MCAKIAAKKFFSEIEAESEPDEFMSMVSEIIELIL